MIKHMRLLIVVCLINSIAIGANNPHRKPKSSKQVDYQLESPSYLLSATKIFGYATMAGLGAFFTPHQMPCKIVGAQIAGRVYPDLYKGALPTASAAEKSHLQSTLTFVNLCPWIFVSAVATYAGYKQFSADQKYRKAHAKKKTFKQLKAENSPEADKILMDYNGSFKKVTTKSFAQILKEDDAAHAKLWVKQNPQFKYEEDADGRTALHRAIGRNSLKVAKVLLDNNAKIDGFAKKPSLLVATKQLGLERAHELIKNSRANCACSH
jgi:hypothetical protein